VKSENTSLEFFSSSLCSTSLAHSKDGGTCKRESIEREINMHNLKIECEEEII
jgi:hypothetical protein